MTFSRGTKEADIILQGHAVLETQKPLKSPLFCKSTFVSYCIINYVKVFVFVFLSFYRFQTNRLYSHINSFENMFISAFQHTYWSCRDQWKINKKMVLICQTLRNQVTFKYLYHWQEKSSHLSIHEVISVSPSRQPVTSELQLQIFGITNVWCY